MTRSERLALLRLLQLVGLALATVVVTCSLAWGQDKSYTLPHRWGMALRYDHPVGFSDNYQTALVTLIGLFDYDRIWPHKAPDPLRFKVELTAGSTITPTAPRAVVSVNALALYYLDFMSAAYFRPYIEGGIGGIYTDYQVKDQGSRINFNPVAGFGFEIPQGQGPTWFTAFRASHYSNAGLHHKNRGVNSFGAMVGAYY